MFKRIILTLTFAAAFGAAGLCMPENAEARWGRWGGWNGPYSSRYYGPQTYYGYGYGYGYGTPYRNYYRGYYGPRSYGYSYYNDPGNYYYGRTPRVAVQVGPVWR